VFVVSNKRIDSAGHNCTATRHCQALRSFFVLRVVPLRPLCPETFGVCREFICDNNFLGIRLFVCIVIIIEPVRLVTFLEPDTAGSSSRTFSAEVTAGVTKDSWPATRSTASKNERCAGGW
jgi:hypothetical protein